MVTRGDAISFKREVAKKLPCTRHVHVLLAEQSQESSKKRAWICIRQKQSCYEGQFVCISQNPSEPGLCAFEALAEDSILQHSSFLLSSCSLMQGTANSLSAIPAMGASELRALLGAAC